MTDLGGISAQIRAARAIPDLVKVRLVLQPIIRGQAPGDLPQARRLLLALNTRMAELGKPQVQVRQVQPQAIPVNPPGGAPKPPVLPPAAQNTGIFDIKKAAGDLKNLSGQVGRLNGELQKIQSKFGNLAEIDGTIGSIDMHREALEGYDEIIKNLKGERTAAVMGLIEAEETLTHARQHFNIRSGLSRSAGLISGKRHEVLAALPKDISSDLRLKVYEEYHNQKVVLADKIKSDPKTQTMLEMVKRLVLNVIDAEEIIEGIENRLRDNLQEKEDTAKELSGLLKELETISGALGQEKDKIDSFLSGQAPQSAKQPVYSLDPAVQAILASSDSIAKKATDLAELAAKGNTKAAEALKRPEFEIK